jgi:hypothetical protein
MFCNFCLIFKIILIKFSLFFAWVVWFTCIFYPSNDLWNEKAYDNGTFHWVRRLHQEGTRDGKTISNQYHGLCLLPFISTPFLTCLELKVCKFPCLGHPQRIFSIGHNGRNLDQKKKRNQTFMARSCFRSRLFDAFELNLVLVIHTENG